MKLNSAWLLLLLSPFLHAQEKDWLSGRYEFILSQDILDRNKAEGVVMPPPPHLFITKIDSGWQFTPADDSGKADTSKTINLQPFEESDYDGLLPKRSKQDQLQCASSSFVLVCHVKPNTSLENDSFTSQTGYFQTMIHVGLMELRRLKD